MRLKSAYCYRPQKQLWHATWALLLTLRYVLGRMSVSALAINLLTVVGLLFMLSLVWRRVLNITVTLVVAGLLVIATIIMSGTVEIKYASQ